MIRRRAAVIANEVRMKRSQYEGAFLLVEGRDDRLFLERFIDHSACKIIVADGKGNVQEVVRILDEDGFAGHFGIIDSDFDRVEKRPVSSRNLGVIDRHDLESLLLSSGAFDLLLIEYASNDKLEKYGEDARNVLLKVAYPIGCLRLYSERQGLALCFQGLTYSRFVDGKTLHIDEGRFINEVRNRSHRQDISSTVLEHGIRSVADEGHEPWEICAGPDLLAVLSIGLRKAIGTNGTNDVREDLLNSSLRLAFSEDEFETTNLQRSIRDWQTSGSGFRILKYSGSE